MNDDRELLELAALAAGDDLFFAWKQDGKRLRYVGSREWNPMTDDGDALRLASKLAFQVHIFRRAGFSTAGSVLAGRSGVMQENFVGVEGQWSDDAINSATRRAIVRAAAEIGRSLEHVKPCEPRVPYKLDPPPVYDSHYAATQTDDGE